MGSNTDESTRLSNADVAECSETTVEIKIKTLDSQTFTLRVDKYVPVPELKEQIASVTGVLSEQQRLICRGKVLTDDQLLSAYHVEDGHTLHLVVRQPVAQSPESSLDHSAPDQTSNNVRAGPGMMVGTFNISEQGDGSFPDLNRIVSAVLSSFGMARVGNGGEGIDLNVLPSDRPANAFGFVNQRSSSRLQSDQQFTAAIPVEASQPPIIPDSLSTLSQYLNHLRQEFIANGGQTETPQNPDISETVEQEPNTALHSSGSRGLLTPESLAAVMTSARQMLISHATECLSQLAGQLNCHINVTDPSERSRIQSNAMRIGALFQNLGALLLELGRAIMTLRMGQSPADAMVNAGPSVFVSSTGPNPIMVQPLPFQPGASFGSVPVGTVQNSSGLPAGSVGSGFLPRNIDIRIRTGSVFPRRDTAVPQPQGQGSLASSDTVNSGQQETEGVEPTSQNQNGEFQVQSIPLRTMVAAVPASVGRGSDSSRNAIGILYPVLARVQQVTTGNPNDVVASQELDQHPNLNGNTEQSAPVSSAQLLNDSVTEASGNSDFGGEAVNGRLEQLLRTIFPVPGNHHMILGENTAHVLGAGMVPSHIGATLDVGSAATANVSEEGIILSNMLHQLMPMITTENAGMESNPPSAPGSNSVETQVEEKLDEGTASGHERDPQSPQSPKRQRGVRAHLLEFTTPSRAAACFDAERSPFVGPNWSEMAGKTLIG